MDRTNIGLIHYPAVRTPATADQTPAARLHFGRASGIAHGVVVFTHNPDHVVRLMLEQMAPGPLVAAARKPAKAIPHGRTAPDLPSDDLRGVDRRVVRQCPEHAVVRKSSDDIELRPRATRYAAASSNRRPVHPHAKPGRTAAHPGPKEALLAVYSSYLAQGDSQRNSVDRALNRVAPHGTRSTRCLSASQQPAGTEAHSPPDTGTPLYATTAFVSKCYRGKGDTTPRRTGAQSAGRIGSGAARRYHLVAVAPLDLGAMLSADRP